MNIEQLILEEYNKIQQSSLLTENKDRIGSPLPNLTVSSPFQKKRCLPGQECRPHNGTDFATNVGTPAVSVLNGIVKKAKFSSNACGGTIIIQHDDGYESSYCHMSRIDVSKGDKVTLGQPIGETGGRRGAHGAGNSLGAHLHFGLKKNGSWVDPEKYIDPNYKLPAVPTNVATADADSDEWGAIDYFQTVLDFAGFIPGIGDIIDVINAAIYFAREKYVDGFLSLIAVIPVVGSFIATGMKVAFKAVGFGKVSRALRKAMKGAPGDMQTLWKTMAKDGNLSAATLKDFAKHGDTAAEMLRSSARKLKKLDKAGIPMPDAVYKQMDNMADAIKNIIPREKQLSAIGKIAKGTGTVAKKVAKGTGTVAKKIVALPIRIAVSPITIPVSMAKASVRALTGKLGSGSTSLIKRFVGKSGDDIADMERAVRILFKKKLAANPLLLANMIKTNGKQIGISKYFKNLDPNAAAMLKDLHKQPVKDIEGTLLMLLKRDPKTATWTNFSASNYKNLVKEISDTAAHTGNPYYNTFINDETMKWAVGKSPGLKLAGAWDSKPWYDWPNTKGLKTLDVLSNEIQDAAEKLGLEDTDDPQGVILQSLVTALRYAGALSDENVETIKDFSKTYIKPLYSLLKQEISHYATMENAKEGAKQFKKYTYHQVPGLDENGKEVDSASATASQKWNYLSTHASEFTAETWNAITLMWDIVTSDF